MHFSNRTLLDPYEQYEKDCRKIKKHNALLLKEFASSLGQKNLAEKTIKKHCIMLFYFSAIFFVLFIWIQ